MRAKIEQMSSASFFFSKEKKAGFIKNNPYLIFDGYAFKIANMKTGQFGWVCFGKNFYAKWAREA